jgi:hypothetical protein
MRMRMGTRMGILTWCHEVLVFQHASLLCILMAFWGLFDVFILLRVGRYHGLGVAVGIAVLFC